MLRRALRWQTDWSFFSDVQPEEARNNDYDDHDTDNVENIHYTLPLSHALRKKARLLKGMTF
jgi:hypothetical protein